jgi:hypothetical protein
VLDLIARLTISKFREGEISLGTSALQCRGEALAPDLVCWGMLGGPGPTDAVVMEAREEARLQPRPRSSRSSPGQSIGRRRAAGAG